MSELFRRDGYELSTDPARLDAAAIHAYLARSYWAAQRPRETVAESLKHSLCFGLYKDGTQVGLARLVTDYATYAYLCDVYVLEEHRGKGLGTWMLECVLGSKALASVKSFTLRTKDAHGLYRKLGFAEQRDPERTMSLSR